jgi:hypothetical protein
VQAHVTAQLWGLVPITREWSRGTTEGTKCSTVALTRPLGHQTLTVPQRTVHNLCQREHTAMTSAVAELIGMICGVSP